MKTCFKCGTEKPLSEFYRHAKMKDGHVNKCKECNKKDVRKNRASKLEHYREYDRKRGNRQDYAYRHRYYLKNKAALMEKQRITRAKHPEKYKARYAVKQAVRTGKLAAMPCEVCGCDEGIHAHHDDYNKPLDVRWLCPKHHGQVHAKF